MKTIIEPRKNIALLWKARKQEKVVYRPMKYLIRTQIEDGLLLYNVVTSEMILLDEEEACIFENLPAEYSLEMDEMIDHHFVVPGAFDESKLVNQLRAVLKKLDSRKRVTGFTILPTTECNARCYYCFESDHKRCTLTEKMANDVVEYMAREGEGEPIEINWFGGEPLVASKRISQICMDLREKEIKYRSTMVSNAYLFDDDLIQTARDLWNLTSVQITLDGTEKVYNATKAYVHPKDNPYKRVLRNIEGLLAVGIAVNVRFNVTDSNAADLSDLIDELSERFGGKHGFTCYSHAVYDGVGYEPLTYTDHMREMVSLHATELDEKLRTKGLLGSYSLLPNLRLVHCMADNDSARMINPDGTIGKCENMPVSNCIGDIYNDITDAERNQWYKETYETIECQDCWMYPQCLNLKICPDFGECSKEKVSWKYYRYASLMEERYRNYNQEASETKDGEPVQIECKS